ncbi:MAG: hypothetical protein AAAFM81_11425 [Pseudomonadota bacterium]
MSRKHLRDQEWARSIAELVADSLIDAKLVSEGNFEKARDVVQEEIFVRLVLGDRPSVPDVH